MELNLIGAGALCEAAALLGEEYGFSLSEAGYPVQVCERERGLAVTWTPQGARIGHAGGAAFFRALGLLLEALRDGRESGGVMI